MNAAAMPAATPAAVRPKVLISILNWNRAAKTLHCLDSMQDQRAQTNAEVTILVIDNGSRPDDAVELDAGIGAHEAVLKRLPVNLGFTGGHNVAIDIAMKEGYDFIWLLNNDAVVLPGTLEQLVAVMQGDAQCGAVSPVLRDIDDGTTIVRCINGHDWPRLKDRRILSIEEGQRFQAEQPGSAWVDGTAVLFRVAALRDTGPLDDNLFAYYDDNDIGVRLAAKGWFSRCAFTATVLHDVKKLYEEFPLYMVYLLQRNELLFWHKNTPAPYRRFLTLRLLDRALYDANRLYRNGWKKQGDTTLIAVSDYFNRKFGGPAYERKVPFLMRALCAVSALYYRKKLPAQRPQR
jgi:GT2 family glycosyltransferase